MTHKYRLEIWNTKAYCSKIFYNSFVLYSKDSKINRENFKTINVKFDKENNTIFSPDIISEINKKILFWDNKIFLICTWKIFLKWMHILPVFHFCFKGDWCKFSIKLFLFFFKCITSIQLEKLNIIYKAFTITRIINNNLAEGKIHTMK